MSLPAVKHSLEPVISTALISGSVSACFNASAKWLYMARVRAFFFSGRLRRRVSRPRSRSIWMASVMVVSRLKSQRSTTGQEHIGQQLIARQSRQVQAPGKGVDTVGGSAE
ncbi:hypothetical protein D3C72_854190 [compost metagenome]